MSKILSPDEPYETEEEVLRQTDITKRQLHAFVRAGLVPRPTVYCGTNPGMLCIAPFWDSKKPRCTDRTCRYPDRSKTPQ